MGSAAEALHKDNEYDVDDDEDDDDNDDDDDHSDDYDDKSQEGPICNSAQTNGKTMETLEPRLHCRTPHCFSSTFFASIWIFCHFLTVFLHF